MVVIVRNGGCVGIQKEEVHLTTLCTHGKFLHRRTEIAECSVLLSPGNRKEYYELLKIIRKGNYVLL